MNFKGLSKEQLSNLAYFNHGSVDVENIVLELAKFMNEDVIQDLSYYFGDSDTYLFINEC